MTFTAPACRKKNKGPTPESGVLRKCKEFLELMGAEVTRNQANIGTRKGLADISAVWKPFGHYMAVECKAPSGQLSPEQAAYLNAVEAKGGTACVARGLDDLLVALRALQAREVAPGVPLVRMPRLD